MAEDFGPVYGERPSYIVPIAIAVSFLIAGGIGAVFYFQQEPSIERVAVGPAAMPSEPQPPPAPARPEPVSRFKSVYDTFEISALPASFERTKNATRLLDQLQREPCDREAIVPLAALMDDAGYPRESAKSVMKFGERCGQSAQLYERAYFALSRVSDFSGALDVSQAMVRSDPANGRYRVLRGTANEHLKNFEAALSDYLSTLQLFTNLSRVAPSEFYRVSLMYDAIGRPCDAITPLEMYLSYDAAKRQTPQISQMIVEFANKGDCRSTYANGSDKVLLDDRNIVDVTINGARGRMIVDTGASMVSITPSFASRAGISPDERNPMTFHVVGGTIQSAPGTAQLMEVGNARAASVPVAVSTSHPSAYGPQVDGLLGMTFLARFNMTLTGGALELTPRVLN